jgi:spermidine/putrescine transport system substrate-binding protein
LEFDVGENHKMKRGTAHMNHQLNDMKRRLVLTGMGGMGLAAAGAGFLGTPQRASAPERLNYSSPNSTNAIGPRVVK